MCHLIQCTSEVGLQLFSVKFKQKSLKSAPPSEHTYYIERKKYKILAYLE